MSYNIPLKKRAIVRKILLKKGINASDTMIDKIVDMSDFNRYSKEYTTSHNIIKKNS
tara:strand:- start:311 stop:481 length:171 start_codon:yes stop_codon:yes gene_type:complete